MVATMVARLLPVPLLAGLFLLVAALERVPALRFKPLPFRRRYLGTDAAWYAVATTANVAAAFVLLPLLAALAIPGVSGAVASWPWAERVVVAVVVYDFLAFAIHVALHRWETLWAVHKVHHSSPELDWLATTRAHMFENLVRQVGAQAPLFALGFRATTVAPVLVVYASFALYGHSNLRAVPRWVEGVFVTPRVHRVHHVPATSRQNFGTVFTLWDRLFSRFAPAEAEADADQVLGVPGETGSYPQTLVAAFRRPFEEIRRRRSPVASVAG